MTRVLITGAAGSLGRHLVSQARDAGYTVRGSGRRERPPELPVNVEWAQADLGTGQGVAQSLAGADVILHAASSAREDPQAVDVEGTRRMLQLARDARVSHVVYISIVGIDRIPTPYYQAKLAAEDVVMQGGVPWTILRATQFHDLLDRFIRNYLQQPVARVPVSYQYQTLDTGEAASALMECVRHGPAKRMPDIGGPQVLTLGEMIHTWLKARGVSREIVPHEEITPQAIAFQHGFNTCPQNLWGKITWAEWLARNP